MKLLITRIEKHQPEWSRRFTAELLEGDEVIAIAHDADQDTAVGKLIRSVAINSTINITEIGYEAEITL